jgi:DNA-binding MarR family transcriptional regulator
MKGEKKAGIGRIERDTLMIHIHKTPKDARSTAEVAEARERSQRLEALVRELSGTAGAAALRLEIMRDLYQFGPRPVRAIPRAWPVTREHVRAMVNRLVGVGLAEFVEDDDSPSTRQVRLTEAGTRVLEEIDWVEAVRGLELEYA